MKFGLRTPSLKKSWSARTTGRLTRSAKRAVIPGYGKKGAGWVKNPKKAATNAVYKRTTVGVSDMTKSTGTSKSEGKNTKESKETTALISTNNGSNNNKGGGGKNIMKKLGWGALAIFGILVISELFKGGFFVGITSILILISMVALGINLIRVGISFINKQPTKKPLKTLGITFILFCVSSILGAMALDTQNEQVTQTPPPTTAVVASIETTQEITTTLETTTVLETTAETTTIAKQETQSGGAGAEKTSTKAPTKAPTKKAVATTKKATSGRNVFVSSKGKRYHFSSSCSNGNYFSINLDEAKNSGYTPCKKCAN